MIPIILASQSPRRKQLLEWAEIDFTVVIKATEETYPSTLPIIDIPVYIARQKAVAVQEILPPTEQESIIIAADTVVVLQNTIIGKPVDEADAVRILQALSGKQHSVITGVVLKHKNKEIAFADTTTVSFNSLTDSQIKFYIQKYKPYDKAGAYGIQDWIGVVGIQSIEGDFYNVMGLPINRVVKAIEEIVLDND